jgi:hypothetical protein
MIEFRYSLVIEATKEPASWASSLRTSKGSPGSSTRWRTVCTRIKDLIWLEEIVEKLWVKNRVSMAEVLEVLESRPRSRFEEAI